MKQQLYIELSCVINESFETHYLIYKMINNINGKYYIGQHLTKNVFDNYSGSGKLITQAVNKYGLSSFTKVILFDYGSFKEMNDKEKELVQLSNCNPYDPMSYNLCEGGHGQLSEESKKIMRIKLSESLSGENNPMYGYQWSYEQRKHQSEIMKGKCFLSSMTNDEIEQWKYHVSQSKMGEKNPMYGKSVIDYMSPTAVIEMKQKMTEWQYGTKRMQNLSISPKVINVKLDQIDDYLKMGYTFFKCHFIPKNNNPNQYAQFHNTYWIEISEPLEEYFKKFGGQIVSNKFAHRFLHIDETQLQLDNDGIHYKRLLKCNQSQQFNMIILVFKDKQTIKTAIHNKTNFDVDNILCDFRLSENTNVDKILIIKTFIQYLYEMHKNGCSEILHNQKNQLNKAIGYLMNKCKIHDDIQIKMILHLAIQLRTNLRYVRIHKFNVGYQSYATTKYLQKLTSNEQTSIDLI